jgi:hypothetical protein
MFPKPGKFFNDIDRRRRQVRQALRAPAPQAPPSQPILDEGCIDLGVTEDGAPLYIRPDFYKTHVMIQAPTGAGKSVLARHLVRHLLRLPASEAAIFMDDPKGDLYAGLEEDCAALDLDDRTILFNTARPLAFNPLKKNGISSQDHALWILGAVKACWGQETFDQTPQMARWLFNGTQPAIEGDGTFLDALEMLNYEETTTRRRLMAATTDQLVRSEWEHYEKLPPIRRREETASAYARLRPFVHNPTIKQIVAQSEASLDIGEVLREGKILLSHIPRYRPLDPELVNLLRTLLVQSFLAQAFYHPLGERPPLYLIIEEAEHLLERDTGAIETILNEGRSLGIHLVLIFHSFAQVAKKNPALLSSVLANCRTKFIGGNIPQEDLKILTEEFFVEEWSPFIVKDEITGLEVEPLEETRAQISLSEGEQESLARTVGNALGEALAKGTTRQRSATRGQTAARSYSHSCGTSDTDSHGDGFQEGDNVGAAAGTVIGLDGMTASTYDVDSRAHLDSYSSMDSSAHTESEAEAWGRSTALMRQATTGIAASIARTINRSFSASIAATTGHSRQRGVTIVPFHALRKRVKVVSRAFLQLQEFLAEKLIHIKKQRKGHWVVKPPEGLAEFFSAWGIIRPLLKSAERLDQFRRRVFGSSCYPALNAEGKPYQLSAPAVESTPTPPPDYPLDWT